MSNLNSAFIKVYKKSEEKKSKPEATAPHFTVQNPSSDGGTPDVISYRIDAGSDSQASLRPWLTSFSTVDVGNFQTPASTEPTRLQSSTAVPSTNSSTTSKSESSTRIPGTRDRVRVDIPQPSEATPVREWSLPNIERLPSIANSESVASRISSTGEQATRSPVSDLHPSPSKIEDAIPSIEKTFDQLENAIQAESSFHAVWEVDSFQWPKTVEDLFQHDSSLSSEIGRHLRQANRRGLKVLAVTSASARHGRTTVACCLAKAAARMGLRVALVDGDLHHPQLADQLNLEVVSDWQAIASSSLPLEEAAIHSIEDRITLIPLQSRPNLAPLAPDHVKVQGVLKRLAASFDLVVVDSQHLGHPTGRLMGCGIHSPIDAAILVVDASYPQESSIADSLRMLARIGIDSVGIVENFR